MLCTLLVCGVHIAKISCACMCIIKPLEGECWPEILTWAIFTCHTASIVLQQPLRTEAASLTDTDTGSGIWVLAGEWASSATRIVDHAVGTGGSGGRWRWYGSEWECSGGGGSTC